VTGHGDLHAGIGVIGADVHAGNVLVDADGVPWVVDWELSGPRLAGFDLMQLWASLERAEDRDRLFEGASEIVGDRSALIQLRFAALVQVIVGLRETRARWPGLPQRLARAERMLPAARAAALEV
jgi:hypothetical protein